MRALKAYHYSLFKYLKRGIMFKESFWASNKLWASSIMIQRYQRAAVQRTNENSKVEIHTLLFRETQPNDITTLRGRQVSGPVKCYIMFMITGLVHCKRVDMRKVATWRNTKIKKNENDWEQISCNSEQDTNIVLEVWEASLTAQNISVTLNWLALYEANSILDAKICKA